MRLVLLGPCFAGLPYRARPETRRSRAEV